MTPPPVIGGEGHADNAGAPNAPFAPSALLTPYQAQPVFAGGPIVMPAVPMPGSRQANLWPVANTALYLRIPYGGLYNVVGFHVGAQAGNMCFALYKNNGSSGINAAPQTRYLSTGSFAVPAPGYQERNLNPSPVFVNAGDWLYMNVDDAATASFQGTPIGSGPVGSTLGNGLEMQEAVGAVTAPNTATPSGVVTWVPYLVLR